MLLDGGRIATPSAPRASGRYRYSVTRPRRGTELAPPFWFDTEERRVLRDDEVEALVGREERWVVRYADGGEAEFSAVASRDGWLNGRDRILLRRRAEGEDVGGVYPKSTSLRAIKYDASRLREVVAFAGPSGQTPDVVRVKYVTGGVETGVNHSFVADEVEDAWEASGARLVGQQVLSGNLYGGGAMRHVEADRAARGVPEPWDLTDQEIRRASHLACRASVAILRQLGAFYPIERGVWVEASKEAGATVFVRKNGGPWVAVDGRGRTAAGEGVR